jgi:hypothetical protein
MLDQKVRDQLHSDFPYLFMVGYTPVPQQPTTSSDRGCSFEIEANGKQVRLDLVRRSYTRIVYEHKGVLEEAGEVLQHDSWNGRAVVQRATDGPNNEGRSTVDLQPILFEHGALGNVPLEQLHLVALGREWKIDHIQVRE